MALIFNLPSQIVVQTAAQWAADGTVYSAKRMLVTSDAYYGSTDQRKWKLADGVQTWSNLDYMIEGAFQPLDADLTAIAALAGTSGYLKKTAANTWALQSNTSLTSDLTSAGIMAKTLAGGIFTGGVLSSFDTIIEAFQNIDLQVGDLSTALIVGSFDGTGGTSMATGNIIVGGTGGSPNNVALTLSGTGGTFALSGAGVLTMPNAATGTRGLLIAADWNTFNGKQDALVSATNIKTINGSSILGAGDLVVSGGGLTIGTTTITSGTTTRILYNNAGVVGEYTLTGTGTVVPMATSPTFVTSTATTAITATTSAADVMQTFTNNSSGTPAANYGLSIAYKLKSSTTDSQDAGLQSFYWTDATHATRDSAYLLQIARNGTLTDAYRALDSSGNIEHRFYGASGNYATLQFYSGSTIKGTFECFNDFYISTRTTGGTIYMRAGNLGAGMNLSTTALTFDNAVNLVFNTSTGSKIGTATSQKLAFWNKTPVIQPTTGITASTFVANTSLIANDTATFGGYTIGQIAAALIKVGILA